MKYNVDGQTVVRCNANSRFLLLCASAAFVLVQASNANANPTGGSVAAGAATFNNPSAGTLVINQSTDKVIINWQSFNIGNGETTQFLQPNSNSVALNRIYDANPSEILGNLTANGKLMLVNPNGVFFGSNSRVDVAGLIASTADTTDTDFLAGKANLSIAGKPDASIINKGAITATQGGLVALVAPSVRNDGIIQANLGTVALASAETASVDFYGDNLYSFALDKETTAAAKGEKSAVANNGVISVGGGKVLLTAKVAKNVVDNVINNTGIIEATSAYRKGGTIVLGGGTNGKVKVSGKLNASGKKGGNVIVTGEKIELVAADIKASGKNGGGTVKIGGDYQGGGTLPQAKKVTVDSSSSFDVSATDVGNGGLAVVWSDEATDFKGSILGTGGINGGNGGLAEVSSKGQLGYNGNANLSAKNGEAGTLLLDPDNLFIGNFVGGVFGGDTFVNFAPIVATLNGGTNVISAAVNNISVLADIIWNGSGSFTINAGKTAIIEADIKSSFNGSATQGAVNINAGNNIQMGGADIFTKRGDINTNSVAFSMNNSSVKSTLGNVNINNSGRFSSNLSSVLSGKSVTLHQSSIGGIQNAISAVSTGVTSSLLQLGNGTWNEAFSINRNNFTLKGNGAANTILNAPAASTSKVVSVNNVSNVSLDSLTINGGKVGINATNANGFKLKNSIISNYETTGVRVSNTSNISITNNIFGKPPTNTDFFFGTVEGTGIALRNVLGASMRNNIFNNVTALDAKDSGSLVFGGNKTYAINDIFDTDGGPYFGRAGGIIADNIKGFNITGNEFNIQNIIDDEEGIRGDGIYITRGLGTSIKGNSFTDMADSGIYVDSSRDTSILYNNLSNNRGTAIAAYGNNILIKGNSIGAGYYIQAMGGISAGGRNITISNNNIDNVQTGLTIYGSLVWVLGNAINGSGGLNWGAKIGLLMSGTELTIGRDNPQDKNIIQDVDIGIESNGSSGIIQGNEFANDVSISLIMKLNGDKNLTIDKNSMNVLYGGVALNNTENVFFTSNTISSIFSGITDTDSSSLTIANNTMTNVGQAISSTRTTGLKILNNSILNTFMPESFAISLKNSDYALISGNTISGYGYGDDPSGLFNYATKVDSSEGVNLNGNNFNNNNTAVLFTNSNNGILTGNNFYDNNISIDLDNSKNTKIREAEIGSSTIVVESNGVPIRISRPDTGIQIRNGSSGTLVSGLHINGGTTAILLDGAGSSMQFDGGGFFDGPQRTNNFVSRGPYNYFVLQNNAMAGQTIDASGQIFLAFVTAVGSFPIYEAVTAANFNSEQLASAEAFTTDNQDNPTVGDVFYKSF